MEIAVIFLLFACVVWLAFKLRAERSADKKAALDEAWRIVMSDPNYIHRRRYEERRRADEAEARKAEGL